MALPSVRYEFRLQLSNVDRGIEQSETLVAALHPSETLTRLSLRVLAWCLLWREGIAFGPGLSTPDAPDLWAHDLTGRLTAWIEVGSARPDALKRALQHHQGAEVHAVLGDPRRLTELKAALAGYKRAGEITTWSIDPALVTQLAAREERRQRWAVTIVGDHAYIEADGRALDGAIERGTAA
jgi:uncharacterized protein YaeQ